MIEVDRTAHSVITRLRELLNYFMNTRFLLNIVVAEKLTTLLIVERLLVEVEDSVWILNNTTFLLLKL